MPCDPSNAAKPRVAVIDYVFPDLDIERNTLEPLGIQLVSGQCEKVEDVAALAADAFAIMTCYYRPIDEAVFQVCPRLRAVVRYGIGVDTIDVAAASRHGVLVINVPDYCLEDVADHTCALFLSVVRKITTADSRIREGEWNLDYLRPLIRLRGRQAGFIGFGRIARLVADRLSAFGVDSFGFYDPYVEQRSSSGFRKMDLMRLLHTSDFIFLHAPENEETRHIINARTLAEVKTGAVIINTARGGLVDSAALAQALASGRLAGAGLDVLEGMPPVPPDFELFSMPNTVCTPHAAFYTEESLRDLQQIAAEEVARVFRRERPLSVVNPEVLAVSHATSS